MLLLRLLPVREFVVLVAKIWAAIFSASKVDAVKNEVEDLSTRLETRDKERKEQVRRRNTFAARWRDDFR